MEMEERDIVVFTDDDGNEIELDVVRYFEHEGQEYAVLMDLSEFDCEDENCECHEIDTDMYIFKVVVDGDYEEFQPVEDEKLDELVEVLEKLEDEEDEEEEE